MFPIYSSENCSIQCFRCSKIYHGHVALYDIRGCVCVFKLYQGDCQIPVFVVLCGQLYGFFNFCRRFHKKDDSSFLFRNMSVYLTHMGVIIQSNCPLTRNSVAIFFHSTKQCPHHFTAIYLNFVVAAWGQSRSIELVVWEIFIVKHAALNVMALFNLKQRRRHGWYALQQICYPCYIQEPPSVRAVETTRVLSCSHKVVC